MSSDWLRYQTSTLIENGLLTIGDGYRAKNSEMGSSGFPFARAGNINNGFLFQDADILSIESVEKADEKVSQLGDVVFTSKGTVGRFAFVNEQTPTFVYSPQLCYWRSNNQDSINPLFLFYWMQSPLFLYQMDWAKGQTDMADYVSLRDQREAFFVDLPEIGQQRAIAHILGTLDDKIDLNRRISETLEAMAQAIFKDWFVDFGPVRAKAEGRQPPGLSPEIAALFPDALDDDDKPVGWEYKPLDELADFLNGLALQKYPASDPLNSLPVIKIAELRSGLSPKTNRASREVPQKYVVEDGDFLFSWSGSLLAKFWAEGEGALNQHLFKVTSERYPSWFFSQWVYHHLEEFQSIAASKATTMGHIQRGHLKASMTVCPPDDELFTLGLTIAPFVERTINNELESRTLAQLRDLLLPKLMSGQILLKDAEKAVEAAA